ncbi:hypothetical protein G9F71_022455 [Clostridium sp. FP2]|uniref:hypothetical protein n=1 Tax=Clostridium sp. FP2 TaxID=2724481 RepID=UPI0013E976D4|nr:hypothetical protein [Clostridium sp. FP2]MBZ9625594.1 hypothetical protein [Clostridium sp. FP2]
MKSINLDLLKEVENRSVGTLREIAKDILFHISEEHSSEERIKENIRRKVDMAIGEEIK